MKKLRVFNENSNSLNKIFKNSAFDYKGLVNIRYPVKAPEFIDNKNT